MSESESVTSERDRVSMNGREKESERQRGRQSDNGGERTSEREIS